ncbi:hypothetical protein ABTC92_18290, partial [Acinetobacter baumannii]
MNNFWTIFFTITGWIIGLVSIFYAYFSGKKSDEKFSNVLNKLAAQPIELLSILSSPNENKVVELYDFQNRVNEPYVLSKFDIDNDGEDEIFIQYEPYRVCRRVNILRDYPDDKIKIYP